MKANLSLCTLLTTYPVCEMYIHKQTEVRAQKLFPNTHMICGQGQHSWHQKVRSGRGKSRAGHGRGDKCRTVRAEEEAVWMERWRSLSPRLGGAQVWVLKRHLLFASLRPPRGHERGPHRHGLLLFGPNKSRWLKTHPHLSKTLTLTNTCKTTSRQKVYQNLTWLSKPYQFSCLK